MMHRRVRLGSVLVLSWSCALSCGQGATSLEAPTVSATVDSKTPLEGSRVTLRATVSGGSGEYEYRWEQDSPKGANDPKGMFTSALTQETQWQVPSLCADQQFVIKLTVRDSANNASTTTLTLDAVNMNEAFAITSAPATPTATVTAGALVALSVGASEPACRTYAWSQSTPAPSEEPFEGAKNTATASWRAPAVGTQTTFQLAVTVSASDGQTQTPTPVTVTVNPAVFADVKNTFGDRCDGCHDSSGPSAGLDLSSTMNTTLQGILSGTAMETCNTTGGVFVVPNDPDNSVLWRRVSNTGGGDCEAMPRGDSGYFAARKDALLRIKSWIMAGATY